MLSVLSFMTMLNDFGVKWILWSVASIDRFHLPPLDLLRQDVSALAEKADAGILHLVFLYIDDGLPVVGKHLDHAFVQEEAQIQRFTLLELKRGFNLADGQCLAL